MPLATRASEVSIFLALFIARRVKLIAIFLAKVAHEGFAFFGGGESFFFGFAGFLRPFALFHFLHHRREHAQPFAVAARAENDGGGLAFAGYGYRVANGGVQHFGESFLRGGGGDGLRFAAAREMPRRFQNGLGNGQGGRLHRVSGKIAFTIVSQKSIVSVAFCLVKLEKCIIRYSAGNSIQQRRETMDGIFWVAVIAALMIPVLLLPVLVAEKRRHRNLRAIAICALLGLITFGVFWLVALVWSFTDYVNPQTADDKNSRAQAQRLSKLEYVFVACVFCASVLAVIGVVDKNYGEMSLEDAVANTLACVKNSEYSNDAYAVDWMSSIEGSLHATDAAVTVALLYASRCGDTAPVVALLKVGVDVNATSKHDGSTPLHGAGSSDIVVALIEAGANVNATNRFGQTPLHWAGNDPVDVMTALIKAGADVNAKDTFGETPLYGVRSANHVTVLIQAGADINTKDSEGATPLHYAAYAPADVVTALIKAGADINAKNRDGYTPLDRIYVTCAENELSSKCKEAVSVLKSAGATCNNACSRGVIFKE